MQLPALPRGASEAKDGKEENVVSRIVVVRNEVRNVSSIVEAVNAARSSSSTVEVAKETRSASNTVGVVNEVLIVNAGRLETKVSSSSTRSVGRNTGFVAFAMIKVPEVFGIVAKITANAIKSGIDSIRNKVKEVRSRNTSSRSGSKDARGNMVLVVRTQVSRDARVWLQETGQ